ncbi:hypothetical protein ACWDSF_33210 [Nocardia beijingensis]
MAERRSITVRSDGQLYKFNGDVELRKLAATGTYYVLMDGEVVWRQRVENGQAAEVNIVLEGFDEEQSGSDRR